MNYKQQLAALGSLGGLGFLGILGFKYSIFQVDTGHRAIKFNKLSGVGNKTCTEGWNFMIPWFERPIIYDVRSHPTTIKTTNGTKDMQMVHVQLRVLYRPDQSDLQSLYRLFGQDYDQRILPSIVNETIRSIIAQYSAGQLLTQREQVLFMIRQTLQNRAQEFRIIIDDVSIQEMKFGEEFMKAIDRKQIAQQEAERAKYLVQKAMQDKNSAIIKAEGEARSAELLGPALGKSQAYIQLKRIETAKEIVGYLSHSKSKVYLDAESLMLNLTNSLDVNLEKINPNQTVEQQKHKEY